MNNRKSFCGVMVGCMVLLNAVRVTAQDWPQWRGPNRDNTVANFKVPTQWPTELKRKWKTEVGVGEASPVLMGEKVYAIALQGSDEVTLCLDANTGNVLWQEKYTAPKVTGGAAQHPGTRSTPAVANGKVCTLGVGGVLSCLDAATGKVLWRNDSKEFPKPYPTFFTSQSPIIVDGMCIVHLGGPGNGALIAFNLSSGDENWKWSGDGPAYGSPVLATIDGTKQIITQTEKFLVGVAVADGKLLWQTPCQPARWNAGTPVVDGNTVYYTAKGTKAVKIVKQGDAFNVEELWSLASPSPTYTSPVLKDGFLYSATSTGNLYCINAKTGEVAWTDSTRRGDPASILDAGSVVLALGAQSNLAVLEPSGAACTVLANIKVAESEVWSYPIVAGNRLFVKDKDSVTLWTIE